MNGKNLLLGGTYQQEPMIYQQSIATNFLLPKIAGKLILTHE